MRRKKKVGHTSATRLMHQIKCYHSGRQQKETASMATVVIVGFLLVFHTLHESPKNTAVVIVVILYSE